MKFRSWKSGPVSDSGTSGSVCLYYDHTACGKLFYEQEKKEQDYFQRNAVLEGF